MRCVQRVLAIAVCVAISLLTSSAKADFVLDIQRVGSGVVQPNSVVSFDVFLSAPTGSPDNLFNGFGLYFDISPVAGKGLPSNIGAISGQDFLFTSSQAVDTGLADLFTSANFDIYANAEGASLPVPVAPTIPAKLFRLNINVGNIAAGTYTLSYVDDPIGDGLPLYDIAPRFLGLGDYGQLDSSSNSSVTFEAFGGSQAVPEPGSLALLCTVGGGYFIARRLRKRNAIKEKTPSV